MLNHNTDGSTVLNKRTAFWAERGRPEDVRARHDASLQSPRSCDGAASLDGKSLGIKPTENQLSTSSETQCGICQTSLPQDEEADIAQTVQCACDELYCRSCLLRQYSQDLENFSCPSCNQTGAPAWDGMDIHTPCTEDKMRVVIDYFDRPDSMDWSDDELLQSSVDIDS